MANRSVTIKYKVADASYPAGTLGGSTNVKIEGGALAAPLSQDIVAGTVPDANGDITAIFPAVAEEAQTAPDYTVTVQLQDSTGIALGAPVVGTFSVIEPPAVTIATPSSVAVTVGPAAGPVTPTPTPAPAAPAA